jgi:hypothetical protein
MSNFKSKLGKTLSGMASAAGSAAGGGQKRNNGSDDDDPSFGAAQEVDKYRDAILRPRKRNTQKRM